MQKKYIPVLQICIFFARLIFILSITTNCQPPTKSETTAVIPTSKWGFHNVPGKKKPEIIATFSKNLVASIKTSPLHHPPSYLRNSLRNTLIQALPDNGGIPRTQIEHLLNDLVAPSSQACGGVSCNKIFGLDSKDTSPFLDETYDLIAKDRDFLAPQKKFLRELILGSLTKENLSKNIPLSKKLEKLPRIDIPNYTRPDSSKKIPLNILLSKDEINLIHSYTTYYYRHVRMIQTTPIENLKASGFDPYFLEQIQLAADNIDRLINTSPKSHGTVYRGVGGISKEEIDFIFDLKEKNKVFFLGQKNYPAITSATWNPNVALDFIEEFPTDKYSILYQIDQKNGVTIDSISKFPREEEVIIGSRSSFRIENIGKIDLSKKLIFLHLKEID